MDQLELEEVLTKLRECLIEDNVEKALSIIQELHPADKAEILTELETENQIIVLSNLGPSDSADVLEEMEDDVAASVAEMLTPTQLGDILDEMENDEAADVLGDLPPEFSAQALQKMEEPDGVITLMRYPDDTAGGLMTTEVLTLKSNWTVRETLEELRRTGPQTDSLYYLFVTNTRSELLGVVALRRLVSAPEDVKVKDIMDKNIISVEAMTDQEECARKLAHYGFLALPVVDDLNKFLGVITADDLIDVTEDEATEDMLRMAGIIARGEETVFGPAHISIKKRLPWLIINILTLFIAVTVIDIFEELIAGLVILAVFLPIVSGEGGNAGSQTATVIVRGLALGEIDPSQGMKTLAQELVITFVNGAIIGLGTGMIAYLWKGDLVIAIAITLAMICNFIMAGLTGVLIPLLLNKMNIDPALASAAFVTGFTDTFGFLFFLGIVTILT